MPTNKCKPLPSNFTDRQVARFWGYVQKRGPDECWPWIGSLSVHKYGIFWSDGVRYVATRVALLIATGADPGDLFAIHTCENRPDTLAPTCVNPAHLAAGTAKENSAYLQGTSKRTNKLTEQQAREIIQRRAAGDSVTSMARDYGVSRATICHVYTARDWKFLQPEKVRVKRSGLGGYKLTAEQVRDIRALRARGLTQKQIADLIGVVNQSMVSKILLGQFWSHIQ